MQSLIFSTVKNESLKQGYQSNRNVGVENKTLKGQHFDLVRDEDKAFCVFPKYQIFYFLFY